MIADFRGYLESTRAMRSEGADPFHLLGIIDSRMVEISNHIAVCHRCVAEYRANLAWSWFGERRRWKEKIDRAGSVLSETIEIQSEMTSIRLDVIAEISKRVSQMERLLQMTTEKA